MLLYNEQKKKRRLEEIRINISTNINDENFVNLENIISECLDEYKVLNIEAQDKIYIDDDMQTKMIKDITTEVYMRLSPAMYDRLKFVYNPEMLLSIITKKVSLYVLEYRVTKNSLIDEDEV